MLVSVYIRKADVDKWKALQNKTQAISDLLNGTTTNTNSIVDNIKKHWPGAKEL